MQERGAGGVWGGGGGAPAAWGRGVGAAGAFAFFGLVELEVVEGAGDEELFLVVCWGGVICVLVACVR